MLVVVDAEGSANIRAPDGDAIVAGTGRDDGGARAREAPLRVARGGADGREEGRDRAQRLDSLLDRLALEERSIATRSDRSSLRGGEPYLGVRRDEREEARGLGVGQGAESPGDAGSRYATRPSFVASRFSGWSLLVWIVTSGQSWK